MDSHALNIISLCAGAGGLDLGVRLAQSNARTVCYVEVEAFACEILATRMQDQAMDEAPIWSDLRSFNGKPWRGAVDCIIAGYPCQPFSVAGKRQGQDDPRHLWPEVFRVVQEVEPKICFFENVAGHLRLGFEQVHDELSSLGYSVKAGLFTAEEIGAPHKRERLFILAYRREFGCNGWWRDFIQRYLYDHQHRQPSQDQSQRQGRLVGASPNSEDMANAKSARARQHFNGLWQGAEECSAKLENAQCNRCGGWIDGMEGWESCEVKASGSFSSCCEVMGNTSLQGLERWSDSICECFNGIPTWPPSPTEYDKWRQVTADLKPAIHRMADGMANRVDRIRACGNGVVPLAAAYAWRILNARANMG